MSGWTKLFSSLPTSSIWSEDYATRIVWTTMLAVADVEGLVEGSVPGFARLANVTVDEMKVAIDRLSSLDPYSRTPDHDGRRIEPIEGGWRILNYRLYRERGQAKEGSKAPAMRAYRARQRAEAPGNALPNVTDNGNALPETATSDPEERGEKKEEDREIHASGADAPPLPAGRQLMELWNSTTTAPIPRCRELTPKRQKQARARLRERPIEEWRDVFARIQQSAFCRGENDRDWKADFDWILKPDTATKVLEGKYDSRDSGEMPPPDQPTQLAQQRYGAMEFGR